MHELGPLPDMYRNPEKRLAFLLQQPVMNMTIGYQLDPFVPIKTYIPTDTRTVPAINAGECGQISRTFLTKLTSPSIAPSLAKAGVMLSQQTGTAPSFFFAPGDEHVWIEIHAKRKDLGILIDQPSVKKQSLMATTLYVRDRYQQMRTTTRYSCIVNTVDGNTTFPLGNNAHATWPEI